MIIIIHTKSRLVSIIRRIGLREWYFDFPQKKCTRHVCHFVLVTRTAWRETVIARVADNNNNNDIVKRKVSDRAWQTRATGKARRGRRDGAQWRHYEAVGERLLKFKEADRRTAGPTGPRRVWRRRVDRRAACNICFSRSKLFDRRRRRQRISLFPQPPTATRHCQPILFPVATGSANAAAGGGSETRGAHTYVVRVAGSGGNKEYR